jgi:hypothetical protein
MAVTIVVIHGGSPVDSGGSFGGDNTPVDTGGSFGDSSTGDSGGSFGGDSTPSGC